MSSVTGRNESCPCGSGKKFKHCCVGSPRLQPLPDVSHALNLASQQFSRGRFDDVERTTRSILQLRPDSAEAWHLRGLAQLAKSRYAEALQFLDRAIALQGNHRMIANRGVALKALGRLDEALECLRLSLEQEEGQIAAREHFAATLAQLGRTEEAVQEYQLLLRTVAKPSELLAGAAANLFLRLERFEEAETVLDKGLFGQPHSEYLLSTLGAVHVRQGRLTDAVEVYRRAVLHHPNSPQAHDNLGLLLREVGATDEALAVLERASSLEPTPLRRFRAALLLPMIYESAEKIESWRERLSAEVSRLMALPPSHRFDPGLYSQSLFYLAFNGQDDRLLMEQVAALYATQLPALHFEAPHLARTPNHGPLRIGFLTRYVGDHPVARCYGRLVCALAANADFDVALISPAAFDDPAVQLNFSGCAGSVFRISEDFETAKQQISSLELDVLTYLDIGMDRLSYFLASTRLARAQCLLGGHPVTSGLPTVDYFISSRLGEPDDAADHYSEELLLVDGLPSVFAHPNLPAIYKQRRDFGLPEQGTLYICPMRLQKLHPDFDQALVGILEGDTNGYVVLFCDFSSNWDRLLQDRFNVSIEPGLRQRILFLPWMNNQEDFLSVNALADVILDPFHFGMGSTAAYAFAVGTPYVTWPGRFLRGRTGLSFARLLDLPECVADSKRDFVARALDIARNPALRQDLRQRILHNKHRFFDQQSAVRQLSDVYVRLGQRVRGMVVHS